MKKRNNPISFIVWTIIIIGMIFIIKADNNNSSKENANIMSNETSQKNVVKNNTKKKKKSKNNNTQSTQDVQSITVYITKTGSKYHRSGCSYLRRSSIPISLKDAKNKGYTPCSRCKP